jgi:two-component system, OmpR family, sensor histidine kinase SenX3
VNSSRPRLDGAAIPTGGCAIHFTIAHVWLIGVAAALVVGVLAGIWWARSQTSSDQSAPLAVGADEAAELAGRVIEQLSSGVVILDRSENILLSNPAARGLGTVADSRLAAGSLQTVAAHALATGEAIRDEVVLTARPGRDSVWVSVSAIPLRPDARGRASAIALLIDDVTDARRLDAVRRDFVANVSHELKTPVGALTLLAEAIEQAAGDPDAVHRFASRMQKEGSRLGRLIGELTVLSRLEGVDPLPDAVHVSLAKVMGEAISTNALAAERAGISVVASGGQAMTVAGSETQLVSALANLVENAIRYSPAGTRVAIAARRTGPPEAPTVEIAVTDQGIGISEADLPRVFERFFRVDEARSRATGGTGLGLAIVKHTMANHGGSVAAWSVPGAGSTFTLTLPLVSTAADSVVPNPATTSVVTEGIR